MNEDASAIRTLIVDDDVRVATIHSQFVEKVPGFTVCGIAHTAADALDQLHTTHPDLVLLDLYLPDGSGLEFMHRLGEEPTPPGVIVISAARELEIKIPVVVRMEGTNVELGQQLLKESGLNFTVADGMKDAAEKVVRLAQ